MHVRLGCVLVGVALLACVPWSPSRAAVVAFKFTTTIDATDFGLTGSEPVTLRFSYDRVRALVLASFGNPAYFTQYGLVDGTLAIGGELLTIHGVASVVDADGLQEGFAYLVNGAGKYGESIEGAIGRKPIDEFGFGFANNREFGMFTSTDLPATADFAALADSVEFSFRDTTSGSEAITGFLLPSQAGEFSFTAPEPAALLGDLVALGALAAASGALHRTTSSLRASGPRRRRNRIGVRALPIAVAALLFTAPAAHAVTLFYVVTGDATGSVDGAGFASVPFSIVVTAESSGITQDKDSAEQGIIVYESPLATASIAIDGVGFGLFSIPLGVFVNQTYTAAGVKKLVGDLLDMSAPDFATWDLQAPFGPMTPSNAFPVYFTSVATSIGAVTFPSVSNVKLEVVVPEPAAGALAALLVLAALGARARGRERRA